MGLYSRIHAVVRPCLVCGYPGERVFQFKFADKRLRDYRVGDALFWESNVDGEPGHRRVRTSGTAEPCPRCGKCDPSTYEVVIEEDRIAHIADLGEHANELDLFGPDGYQYED